MRRFGAEGIAVLAAFGLYQSRVLPATHHELASWSEAARRIPDPVLRRSATLALTEKRSNAEAVAVFATLAPGQARGTVIRASTALQVAIDYLDSLSEQPVENPLQNGMRLHQALGAALAPSSERHDWYADHPQHEDGGYLDRLVGTCQATVAELPSQGAVRPLARQAAERCGEGQSHTHAAADGSTRTIEAWASSLAVPPGFSWWEAAAGASSSVAAHALIALAGEPDATASEVELVDAAYFPAIGALTVLLDDLVDKEADEAAGEHNYLGYYPSVAVAADRLGEIAGIARDSLAPLRSSRRHAAILTGVLAFYLSSPRARTPFARPIRDRLLATDGATARLLTTLLRLRGND